MKCYYEELGVERDANDADIKTAYRKLALRWHPDKNPNDTEEAKQRFLLIQQAYEVLCDPQERAFYDNHREQILRGKTSNYEDNCLNVCEYFTVTCFKGFGDDANGFYAVYREVFDKIAAEDAEFMDDEGEVENIPTFGKSESSYEDFVGPFYAYWSAYCTKKTYTWLCPYDIQETKDRRIIRAIEKEMKKIVQKAKKERNDEVRSLVAFVRKRDKRLQEYNRKLEERVVMNRQKQEQIRFEQLQKRQLEFKELQKNTQKSAFDHTYEARLKELEQQYGDSSSEYEDEDYELKGCELDTGNATYIGEFEEVQDVDDEEEEEVSNHVDTLFCVACNKSYKHKRAFVSHEKDKKHLDNVERLRKAESGNQIEEQIEEEENNDEPNQAIEEDPDAIVQTRNKQKHKLKKSKQTSAIETSTKRYDEEEEALSDRLKESTKLDEEEWADKKSAKKKKNKKTNDASNNKTIENSTKKSADDEDDEKEPGDEVHACATCNKQFNSKNKLFTHLKSTNHSIYIPGKGKAALEVDNGSKKKKKSNRK